MNHPAAMRVPQRVRELHSITLYLFERKSVRGNLQAERPPFHKLHGDERPAVERHELITGGRVVDPTATRAVFDPAIGSTHTYAIVERDTLAAGDRIAGPAVIVERETSTVVTTPFDAVIQRDGAILLIRKGSQS